MNIAVVEPVTLAEINAAHVARRARMWPSRVVAYPLKPVPPRPLRLPPPGNKNPTRHEMEGLARECAVIRARHDWPALSYGAPTTARFLEEGEPPPPAHRKPRDLIVRELLTKHELDWSEIVAHRRHKRVAHARQELYWLLKQGTLMSLPQIGRLLHRDHTTVLAGVRAHQARIDNGTAR